MDPPPRGDPRRGRRDDRLAVLGRRLAGDGEPHRAAVTGRPGPTGRTFARAPEGDRGRSTPTRDIWHWAPVPARWQDARRSPPSEGFAVSAPPTSPPPSRARRAWGPGLLLVALGGLWLASLLDVDLPWPSLLGVALVAVGLACLVGGRPAAQVGLVGVGTALSVLALLVALGPWPTGIGVGQREHTVRSLEQLEPRYGLIAGQLDLDLTELEFDPGTTELGVDVLFGQVTVLVPDGVTVRGDARSLAGQIDTFDEASRGLLPRRDLHDDAPGADAPVLELDVRVGFGQIEVQR
ncbi:hypothetical protein FTX61_16160 [Nitriliruptoraceae bacterium ZYF776]|nr:hypothetical protein [Profundirhabdus halotolerans]